MQAVKISIIIPVLNEAKSIDKTLTSLENASNIEVIVVDGGSQDETVALAQSKGVKVVFAAAGRACQMNTGALIATGKILLFLHADTCLPTNFAALVREALEKPGTVAGAFELRIDADLRGLRLIERLVNWRSRFFSLPYGDQAIFVWTDIFQSLGGFPNLPIMEDFELMQRLKKRGKIAIISASVLTSGRRWQKLGVIKTTLINQLIVIGYFLGVPPTRLVRWYRCH